MKKKEEEIPTPKWFLTYGLGLKKVTSSNIEALNLFSEGLALMDKSWGDDTKGDLVVQFKNGTAYRYRGVTAGTVRRMHEVESIGKFLNAEIKTDETLIVEKLED